MLCLKNDRHIAMISMIYQIKRTPLHLASVNGHLEVVKCLLSSGADISCKDDVSVG